MKSILPLIALTLVCIACAGEPSAEAPLPPTAEASKAAPAPPTTASRGDVTSAEQGNTAAPASDAPRGVSTPARVPAPPAATPRVNPPREARRITPDELREAMDRGEAILVDVRDESEWSFRRAKEAIHVPHDQLFARAAELPHEPLIALYCT